MGRKRDEDSGLFDLIEAQRRLADSTRPFEQVTGTLFLAGMLKERLARLTDRQVGQLVSDFVSDQLGVLDPEVTICEHAALRLFRSTGGHFATEEIEANKPPHSCPVCGSKLIHHFGIDEPDFLECALLACGYKQLS